MCSTIILWECLQIIWQFLSTTLTEHITIAPVYVCLFDCVSVFFSHCFLRQLLDSSAYIYTLMYAVICQAIVKSIYLIICLSVFIMYVSSTYMSVSQSISVHQYHLSKYLFVSLYVCMCRLSACQSVSQYYLFIYLSVSMCVYHFSICLSVCWSVCSQYYLYICLSVSQYEYVCQSVSKSLSVCLSIYLSIYLSVCLSVCLSIYLYLSVCLSVS